MHFFVEPNHYFKRQYRYYEMLNGTLFSEINDYCNDYLRSDKNQILRKIYNNYCDVKLKAVYTPYII